MVVSEGLRLAVEVEVCKVALAGAAEFATSSGTMCNIVVHRLLFWALFDVTTLHIKTKSVFFMLARKQI